MLLDAIGTDQVRVLPSIPGTRVHGPADAPLAPAPAELPRPLSAS